MNRHLETGVRFTAIGIETPDTASVESVLVWANRLQDRVEYVIVENATSALADFTYWRSTKSLGLAIREMTRYWSRDDRTEIDLMAELTHGTYLFGECKWRADSATRLNDQSAPQSKVASLPVARWRDKPSYILFALGGFSPELLQLARDPAERLYLVRDSDMLPTLSDGSVLYGSSDPEATYGSKDGT